MKINYFLRVLILLGTVAIASCKKNTDPSVKELLTSHAWIGVNLDYTANTGLVNDARVVNTDSTALEFTKDNTVIFYQRNVDTGELTERTRQNYAISSDNKKIEIASTNGLLSPEMEALLLGFGVSIPTSINIQKITSEELVLNGTIKQNIVLPDIPFPLPLQVNYTWTYRR